MEAPMRILTVASGAIVLIGAGANAQHIKDPPWNPEHINHLPAEVRTAVLAMCPKAPDAGHYFATYFHDQINLHFEHFHCEGAKASFCNGSQCLHQVYKLTGGHYRLAKSFYGSGND
jgi:hypothetical protein